MSKWSLHPCSYTCFPSYISVITWQNWVNHLCVSIFVCSLWGIPQHKCLGPESILVMPSNNTPWYKKQDHAEWCFIFLLAQAHVHISCRMYLYFFSRGSGEESQEVCQRDWGVHLKHNVKTYLHIFDSFCDIGMRGLALSKITFWRVFTGNEENRHKVSCRTLCCLFASLIVSRNKQKFILPWRKLPINLSSEQLIH